MRRDGGPPSAPQEAILRMFVGVFDLIFLMMGEGRRTLVS